MRLGQQRSRIPGRVVGAQHANNAGDAGTGKLSERQWRHTRPESGFPAPAGNMRMSVDEAGYKAPPFKIDFGGARRRQPGLFVADSNDLAATDQHMTKT